VVFWIRAIHHRRHGPRDTNLHTIVMVRLVRAIHVFSFLNPAKAKKGVDGPHKAGHDELGEQVLTGQP
jgi:hypothetical protein